MIKLELYYTNIYLRLLDNRVLGVLIIKWDYARRISHWLGALLPARARTSSRLFVQLHEIWSFQSLLYQVALLPPASRRKRIALRPVNEILRLLGDVDVAEHTFVLHRDAFYAISDFRVVLQRRHVVAHDRRWKCAFSTLRWFHQIASVRFSSFPHRTIHVFAAPRVNQRAVKRVRLSYGCLYRRASHKFNSRNVETACNGIQTPFIIDTLLHSCLQQQSRLYRIFLYWFTKSFKASFLFGARIRDSEKFSGEIYRNLAASIINQSFLINDSYYAVFLHIVRFMWSAKLYTFDINSWLYRQDGLLEVLLRTIVCNWVHRWETLEFRIRERW